tara:strand:- start:105 stop:599 length:495 start_codon:yes stop_codon:yes gene_type:complete
MPLFFEIKVRVNGKEKWANGHKVFKYLLEEYSKVNYGGKKVDPYNTRIDKFFSNIPQHLLDEWKEAYPNVDINQELKKCKAWLKSNTSKAKKDFKRFSNNWLGRAMQNGGQIPVDLSDRKLEQQIAKRKEYEEKAMTNSAPQDFVKDIINKTKKQLEQKKKSKK